MEGLEVAKCPVCEALIEVSHPTLGQELECPECGEALKVIHTAPLKLYYAFPTDLDPLPEEEPRRLG
ncbi:MAG: hypothetical protein K6T57_01050 [Thermaceae bacterium]|nr:hypothetical protein [Thermaceae bacterium]